MRALTLRLYPRLPSLQFPVLCLLAFLQRTPVLRWFLVPESAWLNLSAGHVLRSTAFVALAAGAVDTMAGATTFTANPASPASATAGTAFTAAFAVTGAPSAVKSYTISNLPPGLSVTGATLTGSTYLLNASTGSIAGTPTTAGSYNTTITAWEKTGGTGNSKGYTYTINVTGTTASPPAITTQPSSQTVTAGSAVSFTVAASGTAPLTYQWKKDNVNVSGATSATYSIASAASGDAGSYTVVVTNAAGSATSNAATLTVNAVATPPTITTQPSSLTVNTGSSVSFTVAASGTAPLTYQWKKDNVNVSGATSATYSIASAASGDAGSYTVVVTNAAGSATSNAATLTVNAVSSPTPPTITTQPSSQTVNTGSSVSFTVAASGTAPLTYQWKKDNVNVSGATSATYSIASAASSDAGSYTVVVTNAAGSTTSNAATLTVNTSTSPTPPTITTQPSSQTVNVGAAVTFSVAASGTSPFTYQWRKAGTALSGATSSSYALAAVTVDDAGKYSVVVTNAAGSATSNDATLTVNVSTGAPAITENLEPQTVTTGHGCTFSAQAFSGATYQWQVSANSGSSWTNLAGNTTYTGVTTATLGLANVTSALNANQYRYVVTTSGGTATSNAATLTVITALVPFPTGLAFDSAGALYVSDATNNNIQKVSTAGVVSVVAGASGSAGTSDGSGTAALFNQPGGLTLTGTTLYVADTANATIRKIASDGTVTTLAGSAASRGSADGTGAAATFSGPQALAADSAGNLYVADTGNNTIRKVTGAGVVTTFAGGAGQAGTANGTGTAARFNHPAAVAVDAAGTVYVADTLNSTIRKITSAGAVTTLAGVAGITGVSDGTGSAALFNQPAGLALDAAGNLWVADTGNNTIRRVTTAGVVTTLAGLPTVAGLEDGTGLGALFSQPRAIAVDAAGNAFVADAGNAALRKVTTAGVVTTLTLTAAANSGSSSSSGSSSGTTSGSGSSTSSAGTGSTGGGGGGGAPSEWFLGGLAALATLRVLRRGR